MQKNKTRLVLAALAVLLTFTACSNAQFSDSSSDSSPSEVTTSSASSEPSPPSSSIMAGDRSSEEATNVLLSAHFEQKTPTGLLYWELEITDAEELKLLEELLNTDDLSPLKKGQARWPDGGSALTFELHYTDETIEGACNPMHKNRSENDRSTFRLGEKYYAYPKETGDKLLEFLVSKNITVTG